MTKEEILEGNKLIAKFVDLTPHDLFPDEMAGPDNFSWMATRVNVTSMYLKEDNEFISFEDLFEFHSSYDWLIPVVEKIEHIKDNEGNYKFSVNIGKDYCAIIYNDFDGFQVVVKSVYQNKIMSIFEAVVEFIKLFNENKLDPPYIFE